MAHSHVRFWAELGLFLGQVVAGLSRHCVHPAAVPIPDSWCGGVIGVAWWCARPSLARNLKCVEARPTTRTRLGPYGSLEHG